MVDDNSSVGDVIVGLSDVEDVTSFVGAAWRKALRVQELDHGVEFAELGGDILSARLVLEDIRTRLKVDLKLADLCGRQTVCGLSRLIQRALRNSNATRACSVHDGYHPASYGQSRMWFALHIDGASEAYHMPLALWLRGDLDEVALFRALDRLVHRHEPLRTGIVERNGECFQVVRGQDQGFKRTRYDLRERSHVSASNAVQEYVLREYTTPFDLRSGRPVRSRLLVVEKQVHVLLITMHHICTDGWSMRIFQRELAALYNACRAGRPDPLAQLPVQYREYAAWQRYEVIQGRWKAQEDYWQCLWRSMPMPREIMTDRPRPRRPTFFGSSVAIAVDHRLTENLKRVAHRHQMTLFQATLAGCAIALGSFANTDTVAIGTAVANRGRKDVENLIGFFVNTVVIQVDLSNAPAVDAILKRVKATCLNAQRHQDVPFELAIRSRGRSGLREVSGVQIMFAWQEHNRTDMILDGLDVQAIDVPVLRTPFELLVILTEKEGGIAGQIVYATELFEQSTVERLAASILQALVTVGSAEALQAARIDAYTGMERPLAADRGTAESSVPFMGTTLSQLDGV